MRPWEHQVNSAV